MTTEEALRVVESVLNEYRGIKRLAEILEPVLGAEVRVTELGAQVAALQKENADLMDMGVKLAAEISEKKKADKDAHTAAVARMDKMIAGKQAEVVVAEGRLNDLRAEISAHEDVLGGTINGLVGRITELREEANAEEDRLTAAHKALKEIKAAL